MNKYFYPIYKMKIKPWIKYWLLKKVNHGLPLGFQPVEYIGMTGTQFIDTGLKGNEIDIDNFEILTKVSVLGTSQDKPIFGSYTLTSWNSYNLYIHLTCYSSKWYYGTTNKEGNFGTYNSTVGTIYEVDFNNSNHEIEINSEKNLVSEKFGMVETASFSIGLRGSIPNNYRMANYNYFYFKIINKLTNKLVRDFIPCYRKSDGEIGMYDLVEGTFYTNAGSGTFEKGSDV